MVTVAVAVVAAVVGLLLPMRGDRDVRPPGPVGAGEAYRAPQYAFDLPTTATLRKSPKKVFAHYFTQFPVSQDNRPPFNDYYAVHYLTPQGEGGKHAAYGGFLRDRPIGRLPRPQTDWDVADMRTEVRQAIAAGIDGFTLNLLQLPVNHNPYHWRRSLALIRAAALEDPGFKIVLMPDMAAGPGLVDARTLATYVAELGRYQAAFRLRDGRLVVAPYLAERKAPAWWQEFLRIMKVEHGITVAFVPLFHNEQSHFPSFGELAFGLANWGSRSPGPNNPKASGSNTVLGRARRVVSAGKVWMQPVSVQDMRPRSAVFDEAANTTNLRNTWEIAIASRAQWVQLVTWNDYSEHTHFAPSVKHGTAYLDISAYYLTWFKTGVSPKIKRDRMYVTHRTQFAGDTPSVAHRPMQLRPDSVPVRDEVEALAFLARPGTIRVTAGDMTRSCSVPAGVQVCTLPLRRGTVRAEIRRGTTVAATVVSPYPVVQRPLVQDLQYVVAGDGDIRPASTARTNG